MTRFCFASFPSSTWERPVGEVALRQCGARRSKPAAKRSFGEMARSQVNEGKVPRVQLLTITGLLDGTHRAEHPDYEPDLNFKKAKAEARGEQTSLL